MLLELININDTSCKLTAVFRVHLPLLVCFCFTNIEITQISPQRSCRWSFQAVLYILLLNIMHNLDCIASSRKWYNWMIYPILQALYLVLISSSLQISAGSSPSQFLNLTQEVMTSTRCLPKMLSRKKTWDHLELKLIKVTDTLWTNAAESQ